MAMNNAAVDGAVSRLVKIELPSTFAKEEVCMCVVVVCVCGGGGRLGPARPARLWPDCRLCLAAAAAALVASRLPGS